MYKISYSFRWRSMPFPLQKFLLVMKLTLLLLTVGLLQVSAASYAQKISLSVKDASLESVFDQLRQQSGYNFLYSTKVLSKGKPVSISVQNEDFKTVLKKCFDDQPFTYIIHENNIVIRARTGDSTVISNATQSLNDAGMQNPDIVVSGTVVDSKGLSIPGVTIKLKGTSQGMQTDPAGKFSMKVPDANGTLVFTFIGYVTQEIALNGRTVLNVVLAEQRSSLDEVVVVGYGTRKKSDVTGAVSSISESQLRQIPAGDIGTALQGAAPGLQVGKGNGNSQPGTTPVIRIRGERSLNGGNDPLIILDGVPFAGSLNDINPDDIVGVQVLKDASATAIYGARGSNGVLLIQTRRGKSGKTVINYNGYAGFNHILGQYDVMDADQFLTFRKWGKINGTPLTSNGTPVYTGLDDPKLITGSLSVFTDPVELGLYQSGVRTNWQNLLYKTPLITNHQVNVSGGNENTQYDASLGYYHAGGIFPGQGIDRYSLKMSIDHKVNEYIKFGISTLDSYTVNQGQNNAANFTNNPVSQFLQASPFSTPYKPDGSLYTYLPGSNQNVWNPLTDFAPGARVDMDKRLNTFNTAYAEVNLTHGFKYRLNAGLQINPQTKGRFYASNTLEQLGQPNAGYNYNGTGYDYTLEHLLTYDKTIAKDHNINFTGLYSFEKNQTESNSVSYRNVLGDYIQYYNPAYASNITSSGDFAKYSIVSFMGRLNYTYKGKYLATFTIRRDGSSRLAEGKKWNTYPAAALGWNIDKEDFLANNKVISGLKLRASYGTTASTNLNPYQTIGLLTNTYYQYGGTNVNGTYPDPSNSGNPQLTWENTTTLNLGLDFGLFNNRINGSVEWYRAKTTNIFLYQVLPPTTGYSKILINLGETQDTGMEFNVSSVNLAGDGKSRFKWTTDVNVAYNRQRINKLASGVQRDLNSGFFVGQPNHIIYDYKRVGIWQNTPEDIALATKYGLVTSAAAYNNPGPNSIVGTVKVADTNGDGKITTDDKVVLGSSQPKLQGGITNRFAYKNFDFSILAYFNIGGLVRSGVDGSFANQLQGGGYNNLDINYWTPTNPVNYWPKPNVALSSVNYASTLNIFSDSYLKIRSVSLGYTFTSNPLKAIGAKSARIYSTVSNPFTFFSPYLKNSHGLDPEIGLNDLNVNTLTPATWQLLFGVNVSF
jgi:TonB-linked SusC/RagA family outer membrane protein